MKYPKTRAEAKSLGLLHYDTGKPCKRGHYSPKFTSIGKCMACAREDTMRKYVHTTNKRRSYNDLISFVKVATELHKGFYTYTDAVYVNAHIPLKIGCPIHGEFLMNPTNHTFGIGKGCNKCGMARNPIFQAKETQTFITQAVAIWGDAFDYSELEYLGAHIPIAFLCKAHPEGKIIQSPTNHLQGKNPCPQCNHMKSKDEEVIADFLSIFTIIDRRNRQLIVPKELDIYLPEHKLAIEYSGAYYHSHSGIEAEKKDKARSYEKYISCQKLGVRLLTIFDTEYLEHKGPLKRLLRNMIGASKGKLMARKCEVRKVSTPDAKQFYELYHIQGGAGGGEHYGLYWKDKLVACMRFTFGANDRGRAAANQCWTLGRYATRVTVSGGASRLFSAFVKEHNPDVVKSFSDNRYFEGGMYIQLGFKLAQEIPIDYQVWSPKIGLRPKTHYQRRTIPQRLLDHKIEDSFDPATDPRTEQVMTYLMGARRIYDCGKKKWVWNKTQ